MSGDVSSVEWLLQKESREFLKITAFDGFVACEYFISGAGRKSRLHACDGVGASPAGANWKPR